MVSQQRVSSAEFQVHCLGSSADLGALRRSLEARGVVSRARLTPAVQAVVADHTVDADHPVLAAARELGIRIMNPTQAIDQLLTKTPTRRRRHAAAPVGRPTSSRPPNGTAIVMAVFAVASLLVLLGLVGALVANPDDAAPPPPDQPVNELVNTN